MIKYLFYIMLLFILFTSGCGDDVKDAYFGTAVPQDTDICAGVEHVSQSTAGMQSTEVVDIGGSLIEENESMAGLEEPDEEAAGIDLQCSPVIEPSGEDRDNIVLGCDQGCEELARCAIDEARCPGFSSCDHAGIVDACMAICNDALLAVFSTLSDCTQVIDLAKRGLGTEFSMLCEGI